MSKEQYLKRGVTPLDTYPRQRVRASISQETDTFTLPSKLYEKKTPQQGAERIAYDRGLGEQIVRGRELFVQAQEEGKIPEGYESKLWGTDAIAARDELVQAYIHMPYRFVHRYRGKDFDDLEQEACIALVIAAEQYDPEKGEFEHFAAAKISGSLEKVVTREFPLIKVPHNLTDKRSFLLQTDQEIQQDSASLPSDAVLAERLAHELLKETLKRQPTAEEIAQKAASLAPYISLIRGEQSPASLDQEFESMSKETPHSFGSELIAPEDVAQTAADDIYLEEVFETLYGSKTITPKQKIPLLLQWIDGLNTEEIARVLGTSQPNVYQTIKRAREKAINALREKGLIPADPDEKEEDKP